jgi:hypothetical protein
MKIKIECTDDELWNLWIESGWADGYSAITLCDLKIACAKLADHLASNDNDSLFRTMLTIQSVRETFGKLQEIGEAKKTLENAGYKVTR